MTPELKRDTPAILVCPHCLTLCSGTAVPHCPTCQLALGWMYDLEILRGAFRAIHLRWPMTLRLEAPSAELSRPWSAEIRLPVGEGPPWGAEVYLPTGDGDPWKLRVDGPPYVLHITGPGRTHVVSLPGVAAVKGVNVRAVLLAASVGNGSPGAIEDFAPREIDVGRARSVVLGSEIGNDVQEIADTNVALRHCAVVHRQESDSYWIVDMGSRTGTFVNRRQVLVSRLVSGDFLQLGNHAWIFNESDGWLVPVRAIDGIDLRLSQVALKDRLLPLDLYIPPGQLVAVAGASGAGKSTLMRALLGEPYSRSLGTIAAGGYDCDRNRDEYRRRLGYVSQLDVVHADLHAHDAVQFGAELREKHVHRGQVTELLRRLDLQQALWQKKPGHMSGGESQRVRIAAELIAGPQLLFLDEPAKGLDHGREVALMKLLRSLSYQGCTVIVITHSLGHLGLFDRVLLLRKTGRGGRLCFDGTPEELLATIPTREFVDLDLPNPPEAPPPPTPRPGSSPKVASPTPLAQKASAIVEKAWSEASAQFPVLFRRELSVAANSAFRRMVLPLLLVPLVFSASISLAVPTEKLHLLGFLAVLASIWMGASLGLLAIVNERTVFDHERLLFLRLFPYVTAKTSVLWLFSAIQTIIFTLLLSVFRALLCKEGMLREPGWVAFYLTLVGWAAVGVGLIISAFSGRRSIVANFILPLVMMLQIVFSVEIAGDSDVPVDTAYGKFQVHYCQSGAESQRRATFREPRTGVWLCPPCQNAYAEFKRMHEGFSKQELCEAIRGIHGKETAEEAAKREKSLPSFWAAWFSRFTLSRYGDMTLRSFAYYSYVSPDAGGYWTSHATVRLIGAGVCLPLFTVLILWLQTTGKTYPVRELLSQRGRRGYGLRLRLWLRTLRDSISRWVAGFETRGRTNAVPPAAEDER